MKFCKSKIYRGLLLFGALLFSPFSSNVHAEAMLQLFNTSWKDLAAKMPELAEAGYTSLWLPPPTKGSGGLSVGYDLWDPFDLGSKNQRNSVSTRYGTEAELLHMMEVAHRFGIRVYFDNIMNHRAFDVPGYNENTPIDTYPGMVPEDFHLRKTEDGFYRKWDNCRDWGSSWQVQNLGLADLIDIAHETPNANFGLSEGSTATKYSFIRDLARPEQYDKDKNGNEAYFGVLIDQARAELSPNATAAEVTAKAQTYINANKAAFTEDVGAYLIRAARWLMDRTKADGLRLDAVKHVPDYFYGMQSGANKNASDAGYCGGIQKQFHKTRGFTDTNFRDSLFDVELPRNDAMVFGEHLGTPPGYTGYVDAGMRLVDNELRSKLNGVLGNPSGTLSGLDSVVSAINSPWSDGRGFAPEHGVMHATSHDSDYAAQRQLQHAMYYTRAGLGLVYSDGNTHSQVLGDSGGAFPRNANTAYLGQWGDPRIPNLARINGDFARGIQAGLYGDNDFLAYERRDNRNADGSTRSPDVTMVVMLNDNTASGVARNFSSSFPADAYLYQYATGPNGSYQAGFYKYGNELSSVVVPAGGYYIFSYRTPELSTLWPDSAVTLYQNGVECPTLYTTRKDGPDGDSTYNPYGLANRGFDSAADMVPFTYRMKVPVVKGGSPLTILTRTDGSAENILLKLDGGVDLNGIGLGNDAAKRDNPPGLRTDTFLGYEQPTFRDRQHPEKFAAIDTTRCQIGSPGAETYVKTIGGSATANNGPIAVNNYGTENGNQPSWLYHDPNGTVGGTAGTAGVGGSQFVEGASDVVIWVKSNSVGGGYRFFVYYTTDETYPEGAGGIGRGNTKAVELFWRHNQGSDDWWSSASIPKPSGGTKINYKIGAYKNEGAGAPSWFPAGPISVAYKKKMLTTFRVADFNPATVQFHLHNDYNSLTTGLKDGFHVLRARAFLKRDGQAPLYQTFTQTFYYDAQTPRANLVYPSKDGDTVGGSSYEMVIRTDATVTEVWAHIDDIDDSNDDAVTKSPNGNGAGGDPFVDTNGNDQYDVGETFTDLNGNGVYDASSSIGAWVQVGEVTQNPAVENSLTREFRFRYKNIPAREPFTDLNENGTRDENESYTDLNNNGKYDDAAQIKLRFLESSSSRNFSLNSDEGHYSEITRDVRVNGPDMRMNIAWPQRDGDTVGDNYKMKVYLSGPIADGLSQSEILSRMSFSIASTESGTDRGAVDQSLTTANTSMNWGNYGANGAFRELSVTLPSLYNDQPNFLHRLRVTYADPVTGVTLEEIRFVKASPSARPFIAITNPPERGSDGKTYEIILPDGPGTDILRFDVQVQTSSAVTSVSLSGNPAIKVLTETYTDANFNNQFDAQEPYVDTNSNGSYDVAEPYTDTNANGLWNAGEPFTDTNENSQYDDAEIFTDLNENGAWDMNEQASLVENTDNGIVNGIWDGVSVTLNSTSKIWNIPWMITAAGNYQLTATGTSSSGSSATSRTARVILRQPSGFTDADSDNDGLSDTDEATTKALPTTTSDGWTNGDVHVHYAFGNSLPTCPDSDGDGLPDGLEVGWRTAGTNTDTNTTEDTNLDGYPNFIGDIDPPLHAVVENAGTVPGVGSLSLGDDRSRQAAGSVTDPTNPDTDGDGILDGAEDANRNGWTDGDGKTLPLTATIAQYATARPNAGDWPNNKIDSFETWTETSPTNSDSDGDGLKDGYGEDKNVNGYVDGDTNRNRVYDAGEAWTETNPLKFDTDGDGLPDGWEVSNGLDPLDNGTDSFRTALANDGNPSNGANGDPDGDGNTNLQEYLAGTDPQKDDRIAPVTGDGTIRIGTFSDWKPDDLLALDEYDSGGNVSDIYRTSDGYDTSRDLVAFSCRDGGDPAASGDGKLYFRADFLDLQANAWQGYIDLYVVINVGNTGAGEKALPDQVDLTTTMGWQAVVAVWGQNSGTVYVDTNPANNTDNVYQDPSTGSYGVVSRGIGSTGLVAAQWSSTQDACEFSMNRQTLKDLGWSGDPNSLHFQVYATKDGTATSPAGAGELAGRNDLRDTIGDDWICSDYWKDSSNISLNAKLSAWFGRGDAWNDRGKAAKVLLLAHANQALQPASFIHGLIKSSAANGPGYSRWLKVHEDNSVPVSVHITATLASALQWASSTDPTKDGPAFNQRIKTAVAQGWLDLLGTTYADHVLKYFPQEMNRQNVMAARDLLDGIYGSGSAQSSRSVFWPCERVLDNASLEQIRQIGFPYTFADQGRHLLKWFGRTSALGDSGYRINEVNGMRIIPIHDSASDYLSQTSDSGTAIAIRQLLSRRARSGVEDQVVTLWRDLGDMGNETILAPYETNVRWLVNRPWVKLVTATDIAAGRVPYKGTDGQSYTTWGPVDQGTDKLLTTAAKDWIDHANQESYDNWYNGSSYEEGLKNKRFPLRGSTLVPQPFGQPGVANTVSDQVWTSLFGIATSQPLSPLAQAALGASLFQTAFHTTSNNDLSKFSTGDYMNPDTTTGQALADFAKFSQAQTRKAGIYARVQQWSTSATSSTLVSSDEDIDLDGENEYLLYNSRLFAVFEKSGGRMTAAWMRDPNTSKVWQVAGNLAAYSNTETEDEGASNFVGTTTILSAYRTSGFKDWWVVNSGTTGNSSRVNSLYTVTRTTDGSTGWEMKSEDGVTKTIRLANASSDRLVATYNLSGLSQAYLRFGLSPDLQDLMIRGQAALAVTSPSASRINVANVSNTGTVRASVQVSSDASNPGNSSSINTTATDTGGLSAFSTINMRNQAQTQQVEVALVGDGPHIVTLGFDDGIDAPNPDSDADGLLDSWENSNFGNLSQTASGDPDSDGVGNLIEMKLGSNPNSSASNGLPTPSVSGLTSEGFTITFPTVTGLNYQVVGTENLAGPSWPNIGDQISGTGEPQSVTDTFTTPPARKFYKVKITAP